MPYILGIDIGTSFTAAAIAHLHPGRAGLVPLNLGLQGGAAPSVVFLGRSGEMLVGEAAESRGLGNPDRIVRDFKRRIGDDAPIVAGDSSVAPEDLFATIARWVVDRAVKREGSPPDGIMVSHPATWGPDKKALVHTALTKVGLAEATLVSELEAAALHYASHEPLAQGKILAVYDLGGGGFDVAVLRKTGADGFEGLGRPEGSEHLGGADFDDAVFRHVTASVGETYPGQDSHDTTERRVQVALARIRRECVEAKEALSFDSEVSIPVFLPGVQTHVPLTRSEFENLVEDSVQETIGGLNRALATAEVASDDLATILLIGGSSRIPLVAQMLSEQVKTPLALDADPKASISLGAALSGATAFLAVNQVDEPKPEGVAASPVAPAVSLASPLGAGIAAFATTDAASARTASPPPDSPSHPPSNPPVPITAARSRLGVGIAAAATVAATVAALALTAGTTGRAPTDPVALGSTAVAQGNAAPMPAITGPPTPTPTPKSTASPKRPKQPVDPKTWKAPHKSSARSSTGQSTADPAPTKKKTSRSSTDPTQASSPRPPSTSKPRPPSTSTPRPPSTSTPTPTPTRPGMPTPTPIPTRPGMPTPTPTPTRPGTPTPTPAPPVAGPTPAPPAPDPTPAPPPITTPPAPAPTPEPTLAPPTPTPEPTLAPPEPTPEPTLAPPTPEPTTPAPPAPTPTPPEPTTPAP